MGIIKKSFKKAFLPILIASCILELFNLLEARACGGVWYLFDEVRKLSHHNVIIWGYSQLEYFILNSLQYLAEFIFAMVISPFLCGIYSFCFARLNGEKPKIGRIFYFYKSFKRIIMSVVSIYVLSIFSEIEITFRILKFTHTSEYAPTPTIYTVLSVFGILLYIAAMLFLYFWRFAYAENPESGLITALKKSCCCILAAAPVLIIFSAIYFISAMIIPISKLDYLIYVCSNALSNWVGITVYYMAVSGGVNLKIFKKTFEKINEKSVEASNEEAYNIGGNYVCTQTYTEENNDNNE